MWWEGELGVVWQDIIITHFKKLLWCEDHNCLSLRCMAEDCRNDCSECFFCVHVAGKDDDVVKLYDLTSLCTDVMDEKGQNPFTVPVAMLLYR
jgi:hypothetical protein